MAWDELEHPSYGVLKISRVSGHTTLFDSSMRHHHYICLRIHEARAYNDEGRKWIHPGDQIIEIAMSESQFATAICSLNMGSGTPCTLQWLRGEGQIPAPKVENIRDSHKNAVKRRLDELGQNIGQKLTAELKSMLQQKKRPTLGELRDIIGSLEQIAAELKSNIPFFFQEFEEQMEKVIDKAKVEVEAHADAVIKRAGMEALAIAQQMPQLQLERKDDA